MVTSREKMIGSETAFILGTLGLLLALAGLYLFSGDGFIAMLTRYKTQVMVGVFVFYLEAWVAGGYWVGWIRPPRQRSDMTGGLGALTGLTDGIIAAGLVSLALEPEPFGYGIWAGIYAWIVKPWLIIMLYGGLPVSLGLGTLYARRVLKKLAELPPEDSNAEI